MPINIFKWISRILSGILILFVLFIFIGETFFPPESLNAKSLSGSTVFQLSLIGICLIGLGLAWKWELPGGIISLGAYILLAILNPGARHFTLLLLIPFNALCFIILSILAGIKKK